MNNKFFTRVLWLLIPLLTLFNLSAWADSGSITSFTSTSGNIVAGKITFSTGKGDSSNSPTTSSNQLKLFRGGSTEKDGNFVTVTAADGYEITAIKFYFSSLKYKYFIDGGSATTVTAANLDLSGLTATSVKLQNRSTSQMYVTQIDVTYQSTASCSSEVAVTKGSQTNGTYDLSGTTVCADVPGGEISATNISPAACYEFASITATNGTPDNVNKKVTGITAATTITVNFQKKTVNTYVDEIQDNGEEELCDTHSAPTLTDKTPATSGTCAQQHWHFAGWTTAAYKASPEGHITPAGTSMTANGTTYYAVWSKGVAGTSFDGSTEGDYLIYATVSGTNYYATNTISSSTLTTTTNTASAQVYTFTKTGSNWYITYTSGGNTYYLTAPNSNSGNISAFSTTACDWKIAADGTYGTWHIYSRSPNGSGTNTYSYRGLIYRVAASGFKNYTTGNLDGSDYFDCEIGSPTVYSDYICTCCTPLGSINGSFTSSNLSQTNGVLTATLPSASKNANATSYRFTLYNNSDVEITHTDVASGGGDVSTTFSSPTVSAGTTYKVSVTPLVSPQGSFCSTTGTESDKSSITMHYTVTLAVNTAGYGSISPSSTLYVASGTSISASTNTLSVGATNITATYTPQTEEYTYGFTNWTWSPSGATITANTTATANFSRSTRTYNVTTTGITHATASPAIPATVAYGGSISTTITADANYTLPSAITVTGATLDNWNSSTGALSITEVTGDVSITITATTAMKRIYMNTDGTAAGKWGADSPKFFIHSWGSSDYDVEMVAQPCASNVFYADIPEANTNLLFTRQDPSAGSSIIYKDNTGNWGQSVNITISTNNYFTFNGNWNVESSGKSGFNAGTYTPDMKTIYLSFCAAWLENNPLFGLYDVTHSTWMTTFAEVGTGCYAGYYIAQVPSCATTVLIGRFKPGTPAPFGWSGDNWWGQSVDFSIGADTYDMITIEGWGDTGEAKDKGYGTLGTFALTQYTVSFAGNGGSGSMSSLTNKDCGSDVTLPNVGFTKTGYDFDGWHADVDVKVGGATIPTGSTIANQATIQDIRSNVALTAQWVAKEYTITLDREGASTGSVSVTMTYNSSSHTAITAPTKTGYNFGGWYSGDNGTGSQVMNASGVLQANVDGYTGAGGVWTRTTTPTTLYAKWIAKEYTITLDREGASTGAESVTATYDAGTLSVWSAPSKTGYTFGGYWSGDNGTGTLVISTTGVLQNSVTISAVAWTDGSGHWVKDGGATVYAKWTANVYNITYKDQGNVAYSGNATAGVPTGAPTTHTYGSATALVNGVKDGYRFDGWFNDESCTVSAGSSIGATAKTADFTLYAKWTQVYTVTWSVNGDTWESGVVEGNTHVPGGSKVSALPTAPTSSDCDDAKEFVGWRATAIDGTSASNPGSIFTTQAGSPTISANTTFYAVFADVSGGDEIEFKLPFDNKAECGVNNYTSSWVAEIDDYSWTISNFNNNNFSSGWTSDIRCGRNGYASIASITTDAAISFRVDSVYINLTATNDSYINSAKLQISSSSGISTPDEINIPVNTTGVKGLKITSPAKDKYYRVIFDCKSYTSNGFVRIGSIVYKQKLDTANYVTTCSSCDADATYTNTTPTVSSIDCTGATLTMEDGLATVGADGCHVSDYGFVIGTSDNPAVGGVGVTKLQVGTSDPTIGEDFSYDATGLTKGTHYYIRAYATNRHGTAYSTSTNFWTKNVSSIAITTAPTKTNYLVGETFDATGMVVTATMASGATENVTSDVTYSSSALTAGANQDFAINYTLCETDKSVNQKINVYTLTVTEGTNPSYGTASGSVNIVSITGLGEHKTYTVTVTSSNATAVDNGDNTWTITNPTGNVAVRVDYAEAAQVKVYYKVDGVTVTGLTQDVYQSETTTLPTASELATAMAAQSMDIPDDDYPNFYGWSETEFPAQTAEPTIVTGTPVISAEKIYYAVYTNLNKITIVPSDFNTSYPSSGSSDGTKTFGGKSFGWNYLLNGNVSKTNLPLQFKKNATEYGRLYNTDPLSYILRVEIGYYNTDSYVPVYVASGAGTISGDALTPASRSSSDPYIYTFPASTSYFYIKGDNSTVYKIRSVDIYYSPATVYYMTQFCTNRVTLTQNNPEHGTVEFGRSVLATCGSDKNVSLTITPDVGYQLTGWTVNTASGYADAKTTNPAVATNNNSSAAQNITLTFAQDANKDYDVTATFGLMTVSSWAWTLNSAAIADPLNLYVGQSARLDVAYTPAGVDASKKTYTRTKVDAYINWVGAAQATYSTISGKASTGENTTAVTFTHADGPTTTVNVKVLPLPLVHFADIVHNVSFDDVVATLSDNTLSPTKSTPTHADFDGSTLNSCEEQHLHLVGWIREDWPALVTYLEGGVQPTTSEITGAGNDGSGNAYFFAPGASINTETFNGVTFYAVWAKVE